MTDKKIALIGHGRIGQVIKTYLEARGHEVNAYDTTPQPNVTTLPDRVDHAHLVSLLTPYDAVIAATPYHMNLMIAQAALATGTAYFDLTEDVAIASTIREMAKTCVAWIKPGLVFWVAPQCGLAPGAVSVIATHLASKFDTVLDVNVRVGALPISTNNPMKYYLTWSSEGLVNEYCNPCPALVNGVISSLQPLEGYEVINVNGNEYEAFNTSGGTGTLIKSLQSKYSTLRNVNYKTIRYKGHRDLMNFVLNDLGLAANREKLVDILNQNVPHITNDVVVIYIQVVGYQQGVLKAETYCRKIYGDEKVTAIQKTTACGICAVVEHWATNDWSESEPHLFFSEDISQGDLIGNPFWKIYE